MSESGVTARTRKVTKASIAGMVADAAEICGFDVQERYLAACVIADEHGDRYMVTVTSMKPLAVTA